MSTAVKVHPLESTSTNRSAGLDTSALKPLEMCKMAQMDAKLKSAADG